MLYCFTTYQGQVRKVFLVKDQIVKLPAALEFISLSEHHRNKYTTSCIYVTNYFQLFFMQHKQILCHRSIAIQRYLPYQVWNETRERTHSHIQI